MMQGSVLLLTLLVLTPRGVIADHLPADRIARGPAESVLGGIDIHRSHVKALLERLGKPVSYKKYPETEESAEIIWDKDGSIVHATINVDDVAYAVEVSGKAGPLTKTGRGLMLGGTIEDLQRVYGPRFVRQGNEVTVQWKDGTELRAKVEGQRIASLSLLANVE